MFDDEPSWSGAGLLPAEMLRLSSGMEVVLQSDRRLPLVTCHMCYLAGSRYEPPHKSGLAHLSEHLAFIGPEGNSIRNFPQRLRRAGGVSRAATFHDRITFTATLPTSQSTLGLDIAAERMSERGATFDSGTLEVQRRILAQERGERIENRPYGRSFEILHRLLYPPGHPYHHLPAGSTEGIRAVTCDDVRDYLRRYFIAPRSVLVLLGDLEPETVHHIERFFGPFAGVDPELRPLPLIDALPPLAGPQCHWTADRVPFVRTYFAFRAPGLGQHGWHAALLLSRSLAVGRASPLQQQLIYRGAVAQEVRAHVIPMREASTILFEATAVAGTEHRRLEDALTASIDNLLAEGIPEPALRRAQKKALTDFFWRIQRAGHRADMLASMTAFFCDPLRMMAEVDHLRMVQPEELTDCLRALCGPENRVLLSMVPEGEVR